jgi:tRNA threonylcarbamoyladenosine biosynthesis protein TsaE
MSSEQATGAGWPIETTTGSPDETRALAAALALLCRAGDVVLLVGDLGAGKTVFAQGFAAALGVEGPVTSPTFALVRHYRCGPDRPVRTLIHADVYRTGSVAEVADLALAELVEEEAVALVEWGDVAAPALGGSALEVTLVVRDTGTNSDARRVAVMGHGGWSERAGEVASVVDPVAGRGPR